MAYYNTTDESPADARRYRDQADSQENAIMRCFEKYRSLTPYEAHCHFPNWPITSIRRAITNLEKVGKLVKTDKKRRAPYGRNNFVWEVRVDEPEQIALF